MDDQKLDVSELIAGRELDALVAEKVMGWEWKAGNHFDITDITDQIHLLESDDSVDRQCPGEFHYQGNKVIWNHMPYYSTDISDAWQVVERLMKDGYLFDLIFNGPPFWYCWIGKINDYPQYMAHYNGVADTAPLAICMAALKMMEKL